MPGQRPRRGRAGGKAGSGATRAQEPPAASEALKKPSTSETAESTTITPENELNSPNSPPTETPAPTPARAPPQRTPSNASLPGSKPPAGPSRFKPKAIRRNQTEREEIAKREILEQQAKEDAIKKAKEQAAGYTNTRGEKSTRSRGGAMGRGRSRDTGLWGVTPGMMEHGSRPIDLENIPQKERYAPTGPKLSDYFKNEGGEASRGGSGGGGGGGGGGGAAGGRSGKRGDFFEPIYPEADDTPRVDIEHINIADSDDEVVVTGSRPVNKGKAAARSTGLRPVRLHREEHKERVTTVNTAPETQTEVKEEPKVATLDDDSDVLMVDEERSGAAAGQSRDEHSRIKDEPNEEVSLPGPSSSPETNRKLKAKGKEPASPELKKKKPVHRKREEKPVLQTDEDRAEYERHLVDVEVLANELGGMQARVQPSGDDTAMGGIEEEGNDKKAGRLYLFQFPGVLTDLYNPLTQSKPKQPGLKKDSEIQITSSTTKPQPKAKAKEPPVPAIKAENTDGEVIVKPEEPAPVPTEPPLEPGCVGRMVVRKSGRVEVKWGDTDMLVQRGTETGFLGTGYIIDSMERMPVASSEGKKLGISTAMGMMMGKFVVVPDFESSW